MRSAAKLFHLALFAFLRLANADGTDVNRAQDASENCFDPASVIDDTCVSYSTINTLNQRIYPLLQEITQETDFFSYYRLNLFNKECPFWSDANSMCGNVACAVNTIDSEEDIPLTWRAEELSKLEGPKAGHPGRKQQEERPKDRPLQGMLGEDVGETCVVEYDDECDQRDYCVPEDEGSAGKGDYVSLVDNPERYTGYSGMGSRQVWDAIYRENCFLKPVPELGTSPNVQGLGLQAAQDFHNVLQEVKRGDVLTLDNECLEKRVFHRLISGMHASISTHLCWEHLNQTTGQWHPSVQCFKNRLYSHPEWISNMYFNYALVSRAVAKLQKHLQGYKYCISDPKQDRDTRTKVNELTSILARQPRIFDEHSMFQDPSAVGLKEEFRNHFRNVSRVMDCVGCDKCRLWGKLQTHGYGTALKILFEYDETKNGENPPLRRTELVALMNTFGRISHSVAAAQSFIQVIERGWENMLTPAPADVTDEDPAVKKGRLLYKDGANNYYFKNDDSDFERPTANEPWVRRPLDESASAMDEFKAELAVVWNTFVFVLKSWFNIPKMLFEVLILETSRLWNYWLGLPVPPRSWRIQVPKEMRRDEL